MEESPALVLYRYCSPILLSKEFESMKGFVQHGDFSTYDHVLSVAFYCLRHGYKKKNVDLEVLLEAALLHDFYLYDWHAKPHPKHHATKHSYYASLNAIKVFGVRKEVEKAILSHMYPLPLTRMPKGKEAWILWRYDKVSALLETLGKHPNKKDREELEALLEKRRAFSE